MGLSLGSDREPSSAEQPAPMRVHDLTMSEFGLAAPYRESAGSDHDTAVRRWWQGTGRSAQCDRV
jgi:hypothetical protein